ncbi:hypothetical protein O181_046666 [Austropuccinia psidii MF-1]|uniref:Retroviral polymerase SH3-like domain-containing protein n=1 Tax=Austropuccinia psidii MF-1 TaxID=1389203 RepID=A0A9Q3HIU6_9BASI|nr:hypothetical protein [Austropuccinia psidii MF-1]
MKTPFEKFYNRKENCENLHPFGYKVYININKQKLKSKLNPRAQEGVFLGYVEGHKNFKVFNSETGKLQITHDCIFLNKEMGGLGNPKLVNVKVPKEHFSWLLDCSLKSTSKKLFNSTSSIILEGSRSSSSLLHEIPNQSSSEQMDEENNNEIYHPDPNSSLCFDKSLLLDTSGEFPEEDLADIPLVSLPDDEVSDIKGLPKGWVMENVPEIAPKNILCDTYEKNIISRKREQKQPVYIATVHSLPRNNHAAVNHPMASEWIREINEEVKTIAKHSVWKVFLEKPTNEHVSAFKKVFQYLQGTKHYRLVLGGVLAPKIMEGFSDSDWGNNYNGQSFSGYGINLGGLICWKYKKQPIAALSSTKLELRSMSELLQDLSWLETLVKDFKITMPIEL